MNISTYLGQKFGDFILSNVSYTPPTTLYFALLTSTASASGGGTEVTGGSYARVAVTSNTANFPGAGATYPVNKANGTAITFPTATASWGTVGFWAVYDASSAGNLLFFGSLNSPVTIASGSTFGWNNAGDFTIQIS